MRSPRQSFRFAGIDGELELRSQPLGGECSKITLVVRNLAGLVDGSGNREAALLRSLVSVHSILHVVGGEFVSSTDPPEEFRAAVAECRNLGSWPVLVGDEDKRDTVLSAPIILYDYPQIAPESQGDLFDATEIDEILTLRVLTLSDSEKEEIRAGDPRARQILERSESMPPEHLMKLHGVRGMKPAGEERSLRIQGIEVRAGDLVRLRPRRSADIFDIALKGKLATVEAIEWDYEGHPHLAVVIEDDPGRDLGMMRQPGHRFFFGVEEVEPVR